MSTYIVGDIQGCFDELQLLLKKVSFDPKHDTLWLAGDLVARGPKSLETLRFIRKLGSSAKCILGNHDLHLLAVYLGYFPAKAKDKTSDIFSAEDKDEIIDWLRHQPLMAEHNEFVMCHAGISPRWNLATATQAAQEIESILTSDNWQWLIKNMYANTPTQWSESLQGIERYRYIINAFTRMRFCKQDGELDMECKLPPSKIGSGNLFPWFSLPSRQPFEKTIIFGHWAALMGCHDEKANVIGLDTGCVWGEYLSMLRWEDKKMFTQSAI
ncbi:symmetrical bis(5'-nucleosyl)-tetraphosphatase [Vibrio rumoiensis]|uniref:Bis(5'-nucleosyl)-tetraphosphatase, symmetrical n=1 Tax=Vibrio rumoiensis 1S-45 TaxID=1188252 RepID=A0A1E5DZ01_9VIBR|nr:symmetrical bis(5'-nucleosyl)-tetraphosphatase [Vibrio rumoiensis]OEF22975.1 bis(5'-nucleosyl)-tetraphosphatase (symmetrical) [Vibrio rumoiensis 1S-45]